MLTMPARQMPMRRKQKNFGDQEKFLARVTKTLHYGKYPKSDRTSLPVTELAAEIFSRARNKLSIDLLDVEEAARLSRNASVSPCSLVLALLYLDRLKASNPKYLAQVPPSQLFLISLMVGSKFLQDDGQDDEVNNCEWATYAGMTIQDINRAEKEFLNAIDWEVFVKTEEFWQRFEGLERLVGLREGSKRGWFSYSELSLILQTAQLSALVSTLVKVWMMCVASYTASVLAVLGSTMLVAQMPGLVPSSSPRLSTPAANPTSLTDPGCRIPPLHSETPTVWNATDDDDELVNSLEDSPLSITSWWTQPSNHTQFCDEEELQMDDAELPGRWHGLNFDFRSLWLTMEGHDPVTTWAETVQRFLVHETVPNLLIPLSRFH